MKRVNPFVAAVAMFFLFMGALIGQAEAQSISNDQRSNILTVQAFENIAKGDCSTAEKQLTEALALNHDNLYAMLNLGVVYNNSGRTDKAREMFQKVAAVNSKEKPTRVHFEEDKGMTIPQLAQRNLDNMGTGGRVSGACPVLPKSRASAKGSVR